MKKIATCCYCGSRTVLQLTARDGHELACGSCGAPLHEMKAVKSSSKKSDSKRPSVAYSGHHDASYGGGKSHKKRKRKKSGWKRAMEEVFDVIEDIID